MYKRLSWQQPKAQGVRFETLIATAVLDFWQLERVVLHTKNGTFILWR